MPEHLRALAVILVLATLVFLFVRTPACASASRQVDFDRRRNLWYAVTLISFLANNFWIYVILVVMILIFSVPRENNKLALFYSLMLAVPGVPAQIPGLGVVDHIFTLNHVRLLTLVILLPAYFHLLSQPGTGRFGRPLPDKLIAAYIILNFALIVPGNTLTNTLRQGVFYTFIDIFLPYYVASRSLKDISGLRDSLMGFVVAALVLCPIAVFEYLRHWLLYSTIEDVLDAQRWGYGSYLTRGEGGSLRAAATAGQPIALGYVFAVALGFYFYLRRTVADRTARTLGALVLVAGLFATLSRGPWVGAAVMLLVFIATGPAPGVNLMKLTAFGIVATPVLLLSPFGEKFISYLPFIGTVEEENVVFRQRLLEISIDVLMQNPFFGARESVYSSAFEELRTNSGMLDIVNTYLAIAMWSGLVGVSLFVGFFVSIAVQIFRGMRRLPDKHSELHLAGQGLLATLLGIMLIIFTTSSITIIPVVYWSVAGMGVAYVLMISPAGLQDRTAKEGVGARPAPGPAAGSRRR